MSSHNHVLSQLTYAYRVAKRAQYEAFEYTFVAGDVRVRNASHANPADHEYLVTIRDGIPVTCECPADDHYDGVCRHRVAVAMRTPLLQAAADHTVVADGGGAVEEESNSQTEDDTNQPADCTCDGLGGFPCWQCVKTGRRDLPDE